MRFRNRAADKPVRVGCCDANARVMNGQDDPSLLVLPRGQSERTVAVGRSLRPMSVSNSSCSRSPKLTGAGVAALPMHCVSEDIRQGRLGHLFSEHRLESTSVFAVYASRQYVHANSRTFVDFLSSHLSVALRTGLKIAA
jgi:DNA-binding transcriptional LysR family regulator